MRKSTEFFFAKKIKFFEQKSADVSNFQTAFVFYFRFRNIR